MTRKQRRTTVVVSGVTLLVAATLLILAALRDSIVYFHSPSEVVEASFAAQETIRIGGLVAMDSVERGVGEKISFSVTDMAETIQVEYTGILPDLFREGQGVIVEGTLEGSGVFSAKTVLAKHDENYMPPEVADALKDAGHWEEYEDSGMGASDEPALPKAPDNQS